MTQFVNNLKTTLLLSGLFALILFIGSRFGAGGVLIALLLGGGMTFVSFFFSDQIAVKSMGGEEVDRDTAPDLVGMVEKLAASADLPTPRVFVCPQQAPNAFAAGRNPDHSVVAVTRGALQILEPHELEGVIAHELSHIKNRDTLISTVAAAIGGAINALAWMSLFFMGGRDGEGNPLVSLLMFLVAPFAATLIQLAISRSREYVADADAAEIAGTPEGLASALEKLDQVSRGVPLHDGRMDAANHLFIVEPLTGGSMAKLFATHPPIEERVQRLRAGA